MKRGPDEAEHPSDDDLRRYENTAGLLERIGDAVEKRLFGPLIVFLFGIAIPCVAILVGFFFWQETGDLFLGITGGLLLGIPAGFAGAFILLFLVVFLCVIGCDLIRFIHRLLSPSFRRVDDVRNAATAIASEDYGASPARQQSIPVARGESQPEAAKWLVQRRK